MESWVLVLGDDEKGKRRRRRKKSRRRGEAGGETGGIREGRIIGIAGEYMIKSFRFSVFGLLNMFIYVFNHLHFCLTKNKIKRYMIKYQP